VKPNSQVIPVISLVLDRVIPQHEVKSCPRFWRFACRAYVLILCWSSPVCSGRLITGQLHVTAPPFFCCFQFDFHERCERGWTPTPLKSSLCGSPSTATNAPPATRLTRGSNRLPSKLSGRRYEYILVWHNSDGGHDDDDHSKCDRCFPRLPSMWPPIHMLFSNTARHLHCVISHRLAFFT